MNHTEVGAVVGAPIKLSDRIEEIRCRLTAYAVGLFFVGNELLVAKIGDQRIDPSGAERPDTHHLRRGLEARSVDFAEVDGAVAREVGAYGAQTGEGIGMGVVFDLISSFSHFLNDSVETVPIEHQLFFLMLIRNFLEYQIIWAKRSQPNRFVESLSNLLLIGDQFNLSCITLLLGQVQVMA
ncbi:hypothetical protein Vadar_017294 [Vaccinium darrowii]|uniref:Uncharacterized protein n=1 Tax=Vaccinium darrowii TaxID=229202 RepID=A0ACB7X1D4_9ERIC|nr:hypothetical protein Vadar_017294 [Vaccinium darrowii]